MDLSWFESFLYSLFSGLADILPVSAEAHRVLLLKFFGVQGSNDLINLFIDLGVCGALYFSCRRQIVQMTRARKLARVPKRRRRRPLDTRSLMDFSLLKTMLIPIVLSFFVYRFAKKLDDRLVLVVVFLFVNGLILYIPQFFPTGNRDSRTLSRVEGLLMGFGGALGVVPGISAMGVALSVSSVCGVEKSYSLNMALLMNLGIHIGLAVMDVLGLISGGAGTLSFVILLRYLVSTAVAFGGSLLGVKLMRLLTANGGTNLLAFYCWGVALFLFILNLMA
ncbi:MAG: undecaprenyl-diphosphate phosphatase [Firmicutes bacterium]|nr:undecaprenyl-diphosphate phosphatase [Bacillota bacterium]